MFVGFEKFIVCTAVLWVSEQFQRRLDHVIVDQLRINADEFARDVLKPDAMLSKPEVIAIAMSVRTQVLKYAP